MGKESENILRYGPWSEGRTEKKVLQNLARKLSHAQMVLTSIEPMSFLHVLFLNAVFFRGLPVSFCRIAKRQHSADGKCI